MGLFMIYIISGVAVVIGLGLFMFRSRREDYTGQHVFITGGSQGMGKACAKEFLQRGARVTIVARTQSTLDQAVEDLESYGKVGGLSVDCTDSEAVADAIRQTGTPDVLLCCAGSAHPGLFTEMTPEELARPMTGNYLTALYASHAAIKSMLANPSLNARKVIFTSSVAAFLNITGYASYAPTKTAIRALADTLRLEMLLYKQQISIHCVFPGTIFSEGYEKEQKIKPEICKQQEGTDGMTPEAIAKAMMAGLDAGHEMICTDFIGNLLRTNMKGTSPKNGVLDVFLGLLAGIIMPFVQYDWRKKNLNYR